MAWFSRTRDPSTGRILLDMPAPVEYDPSPLLQNQRLAAYEWGSGEILLSAAAAFEQKDHFFSRHFSAALGQNLLIGNSEEDITCLVALLHEYRHFQQDNLTGLGHWDYLARVDHMKRTLPNARGWAREEDLGHPIGDDLGPWLDKQSTCILDKSEDTEIDIIGKFLVEDLKAPRELGKLLTTRRVLEMDAVLYVYMIMTDYKIANQATYDAISAASKFWNFRLMPPTYSETILWSLGQFWHNYEKDMSGEDKLTEIIHELKLLLAVALAYPDPGTLEKRKHNRADYLPGVRFLRMMQSWGRAHTAFNHGLPRPSSGAEYIMSILEHCEFKYPGYIESERNWGDYFKNLSWDPYPSLTKTRSEAISQKFGAEDSPDKLTSIFSTMVNGEDPNAFAVYDIPLLLRQTDGTPHISELTPRFFLDRRYNIDRLRNLLSWRLTEFHLRRRRGVSCPLASTQHCKAKLARCDRSYSDLNEVPNTDECIIRWMTWNREPNILQL